MTYQTSKDFSQPFGCAFIFLFLLVSSPQVNKYAKELLAAMSSGMEEKDDPGTLTFSFPDLLQQFLKPRVPGPCFSHHILDELSFVISGLWSSCR